VLHESIYCQGAASNWAAHAVRQEEPFASAFDALAATEAGRPVYFTGESVFPWMLEVRALPHTQKLGGRSSWAECSSSCAMHDKRDASKEPSGARFGMLSQLLILIP